MRNIRYTIVLICLFLSFKQTQAHHLLGSQITYKWVDTLVFDFYLTFYRDCSGVDFSDPSYYTSIRSETGTAKPLSVTLKLKSITDISILCDSAKTGCNPANTSNTGKGIEAHVYTVRIDFRQAPYNDLLTAGRVVFETSPCCRFGASSTTLLGQMYNFAMLDLTKSPLNSSPDFLRPFNPYLGCNQPYYFNLLPIEKDGDSLSFSLECALDRPYVCDNYPSNSTPTLPFTPYWLSPLKYPYVNINANPPMGFYFDKTNSDLIFTPVQCSETSVIVIEAKEWRKNKSGVYEHIGTVRREGAMFVITMQDNYNPELPAHGPFGVLVEDSLTFSVVPTDKPFKSPAPAQTIYDSVAVNWLDSIPRAQYSIIDTNRIQTFKFNWKPNSTDIREKPYVVTLSAIDDNCPNAGSAYKRFQIYVGKKIGGTLSTSKLNCLQYRSILKLDSPATAKTERYEWNVLDSVGNVIGDKSVWFMNGWRTGNGFITQDFELTKSGTYILRLRVLHHQWFWQEFYDTIIVKQSISGLFSKSLIPVCPNDSAILKPDLINSNAFSHFSWFGIISPKDTQSHFVAYYRPYSEHPRNPYVSYYKGDLFRLRAQDSSGCFRVDEITAFSVLALKPNARWDDAFCEGNTYTLSGSIEFKHPLIWDTAYWNTGNGGLSVNTDSGGMYVLNARNECAAYRDTVIITEIPKKVEVFPPVSQLCFGDSLFFEASKLGYTYLWSNGSKAASIKIGTPGTYWVQVTTFCGVSADTIVIEKYTYKPAIELGPTKTACVLNGLKLDAGISDVTYLWSTFDTTRQIMVYQNGLYKIMVGNMCGYTEDSVTVIIESTLRNELGLDIKTSHPHRHILDAGNPGANYLWNTGEKTRTIIPKTYGTYWVEVSNSCGKIKDTIQVFELTGFQSPTTDGISIYPNPGKGVLTIAGVELINPVFEVFDLYGRSVSLRQETIKTGNEYRIRLAEPVSGVYYISWENGNQVFRKSFVIE